MPFRTRRLVGLSVVLGLLIAVFAVALPALSDGPMYTRRERFGFAFVTQVQELEGTTAQSLSNYNVLPFDVGWYSDWRFNASPQMPADTAVEYVQLLHVSDGSWPPDWTAVQNAVTLNPGALWLIGNEPECPNQDAVSPATYAERYFEAYTKIKGWSPTSKIAIGGIVEPTPLRQRWLERTNEAFQTQQGESMWGYVDVWNIHMQILREGTTGDPNAGAGIPVGIDPTTEGIAPAEYTLPDCGNVQLFKSLILGFRDWMNTQGEQDKPLIISEMGVLQPSIYLIETGTEAERKQQGDQLIEDFMVEVFDWMLGTTDEEIGCPSDENRLVQRWLWFSLNDRFWDEAVGAGFNGSLYDYQTGELTRFGTRFIYYQNGSDLLFIPVALR